MQDLFSAPERIVAHGMRYIREDLAHPVVKKTDASGFYDFWATVPKGKKNGSKQEAKKAWAKLSHSDKEDAQSRIAAFYSLTKEERIGASEMHVSRYLNSRAWEEEVVINKKVIANMPRVDPLEAAERNIKSGKRFLCTNIGTSVVAELLRTNRVTKEQVKEVGL